MKNIAIICAFDDEIEYFIEKYNLEFENNKSNFNINCNNVLLIKTGVGKVNAALYTQKIIDEFNPNYVINSGCSGALTKDLPLYGVGISENVFYHDFTPENIMKKYTPNNGLFKSDNNLINLAIKSCKDLNIEDYEILNIASGDCYVTDSNKVNEIKKLGAKIVDMESAAIGHVCNLNKIPFVCIRSISDFADGMEVDEKNSSRKAAMITEKLISII